MLTHKNVVDFLRNNLTTYIRAVATAEATRNNTAKDPRYEDFINTMELCEESSYNLNKDIVITLQFLKGTTQLGFTDLPINVIFEVVEAKYDEQDAKTIAIQFMDLINSYVLAYNDTTPADPLVDEEGHSYIVTQYYSSTNVMGNSQKLGTKNFKTFTMDMRLIIYENGYYCELQDQKIKFSFNNGAVIQQLRNVLQITTSITHNKEGYTKGANPSQRLRISGIQRHLQVTYMATLKPNDTYVAKTVTSSTFTTNGSLYLKDSNNNYNPVTSGSFDSGATYYERFPTLHKRIAEEAEEDVIYNVTHEGGLVTRAANMGVINYVEDTPYADVMKVSLTLAKE